MIQPQELEQKSDEFGIHVSSVQRDYVLGWLLYAIFNATSLKDILFLKGGNALRKCYFGQTRYSADIDFGLTNRRRLFANLRFLSFEPSEKQQLQ